MSEFPKSMTAIGIQQPGGPEVLVPEQRPVPVPGENEILIAVKAAGVNRPDVMQRKGHYPPPPGASDIPGLEIAGTVAAAGAKVKRWKTGDHVCALIAGGGYAEFAAADEGSVLPLPKGLSFVEAAALPETFMTVWHNVFERGALKPGQTFLVHGGTSGIGTTAIMLAKQFGAGKIFTTAGSADKCEACRKLGADVAINYKEQDFVEVINDVTGKKGVDLILDMVGGEYVQRNMEAAAVEGRIVQIATQTGVKVTVNLARLMIKRLTHTGSTLRARSSADKARIAQAVEKNAWPLIEAGKVKPIIDSTFPLAKASAAHARMETSAHIGKIVLEVAK